MNTDYDTRVTESALEGMRRRAEDAGNGDSIVRGAEIIAAGRAWAAMYGFRVLAEAPDGN